MFIRLGKLLLAFAVLGLAGCASQPKNINNVCSIFNEKYDWFEAARDTQKKWGVPIHVTMAILHQESKFVSDAKPPRTTFLWIFPGPRPSSAYGYAQALDETWDHYIRSTKNYGADRDDFDDAVDFIGWYNYTTHKKNGVSKWDAKNLYLAYHEGHGGYKRRTYKKKPWLIKVSKKVARRAAQYNKQYKTCKTDLNRGWFSRTFF
jgi:hypothetical protein